MSDWDADSDDGAPSTSKPVTAAAPISAAATTTAPIAGGYGRRKFEDEDVEDKIIDDWEEDEEEEEKPDVSALKPLKKKSTVKQKIMEREEEERRRAELGLESDEDDYEDDPVERRKRERAAQIEADVANAANLLGTSKISQADDGLMGLKNAKPDSKEDWEKFAEDVYAAVLKSQSTKPGFGKQFLPRFSKLLAENLRDVDCRKQSADWKKIGEDKVKAEREKKMGGGAVKKAPKPKTVGTASAKNIIDTGAYGDEALGDDDLDFM